MHLGQCALISKNDCKVGMARTTKKLVFSSNESVYCQLYRLEKTPRSAVLFLVYGELIPTALITASQLVQAITVPWIRNS